MYSSPVADIVLLYHKHNNSTLKVSTQYVAELWVSTEIGLVKPLQQCVLSQNATVLLLSTTQAAGCILKTLVLSWLHNDSSWGSLVFKLVYRLREPQLLSGCILFTLL